MPRAGRRRSVVWTCFVENAESGKRRVLCRFCQHDIVANPIRMVRHIVKHCPNADEQHKRICREYQTLTVPARRRSAEPDAAQAHDDESAVATGSEPATLQPIDVAAITITSAQQTPAVASAPSPPPSLAFSLSHALQFPLAGSSMEDADAQHRAAQLRSSTANEDATTESTSDGNTEDLVHDEIILALASTSSSLELLDNPHFRRALHLLHAKPLGLEDALSQVVPRLCAQVNAEANAFIRAAMIVTIQVTITSLQSGTTLEWFAADQEHRQVVLDTSSINDSEDMHGTIRERVHLLPRKPQSPLLLCTDVFGETYRATIAATQESPGHDNPVFAAGCLMQASLSLLAAVVTSVSTVRRAIDNCVRLSEAVASRLTQLRRESQPSIEFTHYQVSSEGPCSIIPVVDQALRHRNAIQDLSFQLPADVVSMIHDEQFWNEAALAKGILRPFAFLFALSECGHLTSSLVLTSWTLVMAIASNSATLPGSEKQAVSEAVIGHIKHHEQPLGLVCLLLDPRCRGLGLSALGKRKVRAMVAMTATKLDPRLKQSQLLAHLVKFLNKEQPFDDEGSWQMMASLPRLFWIEFMAEAPELASVALVALGLRPFIRSMQGTWFTMRAMTEERSEKPAHNYASSMNLLAMQTQRQGQNKGDRRHQVVEAVARALIADPGPFTGETEGEATTISTDGQEPGACAELWQQLHHIANVLMEDKEGERTAGDTETEAVDATWFAVDSPEAVVQLQSCLHRALLGEMTYMRGSVGVSEDGDGNGGDGDGSSSSAAATASASDALSGLMDL